MSPAWIGFGSLWERGRLLLKIDAGTSGSETSFFISGCATTSYGLRKRVKMSSVSQCWRLEAYKVAAEDSLNGLEKVVSVIRRCHGGEMSYLRSLEEQAR